MKKFRFIALIISVLLTMQINAQEQNEVYYEPELLMVSQPTMELYSANDEDYVQFYYDVKNIGSDIYKGEFLILMEPDIDHFYAKKNIKVKAGEIKRIKIEMDLSLVYYDSIYTVLPVYEFENQWYPLTAYEQFKSIALCVNAPVDASVIVDSEPELVTDYYFDVRLQRPPVYGYYYVTPPVGWAYAYGYSPYCVCNNYVIVNTNGCYTYPTGIHVEGVPSGVVVDGGSTVVVTTTVNDRKSAPRVSGNRYSSSASTSASGSSSRRRDDQNSGGSSSGARSGGYSVGSSYSGASSSGSRSSGSSSSSRSALSGSSTSSGSSSRSSSSARSSSSSSSQPSVSSTPSSSSSSSSSRSSSSGSSSSGSRSGSSSGGSRSGSGSGGRR